jgi:hypothetical protein
MLRRIDISVPAARTEDVLSAIKDFQGVLSIQLQRGGGIAPPGDVITIHSTNTAVHPLMRLMEQLGVTGDSSCRITSTESASAVSMPHTDLLSAGSSDLTWEEMETNLGKESNMTVNGLFLMAVAGMFAAIGISTNALHYVIAGMVIAPGFEPAVRVSLGMIAGSQVWRRGVRDLLLGYGTLIFAAAVTTAVLIVAGKIPFGSEPSYHEPYELIRYWTKLSPTSLAVDLFAGAAGAVLVATGRSVLTAGVMIALALVPAATLIGVGVILGDPSLAGVGAARWIIDVAFVIGASALVFHWKRRSVQRRRMFA